MWMTPCAAREKRPTSTGVLIILTSVNYAARSCVVAAVCIAIGSRTVHSTQWSQIVAENRLLHLHSMPSLGGPSRNIAITFGTDKLE